MEVNRRHFLYSIAGSATAIAGWVLIPGCKSTPISQSHRENNFYPQLADGIVFQKTKSGGELINLNDQKQVVCEVNEYGLKILEDLDGKNTLQDLAGKLHTGFDPEHLEHVEASVASFLADLAQAGVLSEPFFVNLYSSEVTA